MPNGVKRERASSFNHSALECHSANIKVKCQVYVVATKNTDWTNKGDHMASDIAFGKAGASVRKEILPFALECFIIRTVLQCGMVLNKEVLGKISFQSPAPFSESTWIVCR